MLCAGFAQAQKLQRAQGYLCGMEEGDGGYPSLRIGIKVVGFGMYNDEPEVKYTGLKNRNLFDVIGHELIITYVVKKKDNSMAKVVRSITLTGKVNKRIKPCKDN